MQENLHGHILVVDDNKLNRMLLLRLLSDLGHQVTQAENGIVALNILEDPATQSVDVVLLDILMPELDGYGLLEKVKGDTKLRNIPVIMTSALDELDSVVRCIEIGATDYLTKPVQPALLKARLKSSLAEKRLRDLELEYLEQVGYVVSAAESVESQMYDPESLRHVAMRKDALGRLARVFQKMAQEVHLREQRLKQQLAQLQLDIEEMQKALAEKLEIYLPMDRRQALYKDVELPRQSTGAVLFADISDFTRLTNALAEELGRTRGAEEITRLINQIFAALVEEVHAFRGSVISFSGDAITCWFDDHPITIEESPGDEPPDGGMRATVCAMYMQMALRQFNYLASATRTEMKPGIKVAVVSGPAHRFLVGDAKIQYLEVLVGRTLEKLETAEHLMRRGEVVIDSSILKRHEEALAASEVRVDEGTGEGFAVMANLKELFSPDPWPPLPENALSESVCRPWIHPVVFQHAKSNTRQFLSDLRPAAALFVYFHGIDVDTDPDAPALLDQYICWIQNLIDEEGGAVLQLTFGDKGSYLYASFGAPVTHTDDAVRAVRTAIRLLDKPNKFNKIRGEQVGISHGYMRTGTYGGDTRRTYGVIGNQTNLAARLMQAAAEGTVLCDEETYRAAAHFFEFEALPSIKVKGRQDEIAVYRPGKRINQEDQLRRLALNTLDKYSPGEQMVLKIASVIGLTFSSQILWHLMPGDAEQSQLESNLNSFRTAGIILSDDQAGVYHFSQAGLHEAIYQSMLYVQRRHLHRQIALTVEEVFPDSLAEHYPDLAHHWQAAEESTRAIDYLDRAGRLAQENGELEKAQAFLRQSLELSASESLLSKDFRE